MFATLSISVDVTFRKPGVGQVPVELQSAMNNGKGANATFATHLQAEVRLPAVPLKDPPSASTDGVVH